MIFKCYKSERLPQIQKQRGVSVGCFHPTGSNSTDILSVLLLFEVAVALNSAYSVLSI